MPGPSNFGHFDHFSYGKRSIFVILPIRVSENAIWPYFDLILSPPQELKWGLRQIVPIFGPLPGGTLEGPLRTQILTTFWLFWTLWGSWGGCKNRPLRAAFGLEDLLRALKPMPGTPNFGHFDHFSYWKVLFVILPIRGQWNAIWPYFDPILSPPEPKLPWPRPKCAYLAILPDGGPRFGGSGLKFDPIQIILGPLWGSWGFCNRNPGQKLPLASLDGFASEPHKPMPGTSNFGHFDPLDPHFGSKTGVQGFNRRVHRVKGRYRDFGEGLFEVLKKVQMSIFLLKWPKIIKKSRNLLKCASKQRVQIHGF